jgi:hypothetical protein
MNSLFADTGAVKKLPAAGRIARKAAPETLSIEVINGNKSGEEKVGSPEGRP